jgi:hypothetical protein
MPAGRHETLAVMPSLFFSVVACRVNVYGVLVRLVVAFLLFLFGFMRLQKSKCATKSGGTLSS